MFRRGGRGEPEFVIVRVLLVRIRQRGVGLRNQLEFPRLDRIVPVHVGVQSQRQLPVRRFDLVDVRRVRDAEDFVKIFRRCCVRHDDRFFFYFFWFCFLVVRCLGTEISRVVKMVEHK